MSAFDARRDVVGAVLAIRRKDWDGYGKLVDPYAFTERQRPFVNQLVALCAQQLEDGDLEGFAAYLAEKDDEGQ